jgi:hypothetical protein
VICDLARYMCKEPRERCIARIVLETVPRRNREVRKCMNQEKAFNPIQNSCE